MTALPDWLGEFVPLLDPTELPRVLTRSEAHARGYTDAKITHRIRAGHWRRMTAGVYLTVPDARTDDHWLVAVRHGGPRSVLTGKAALAARGMTMGTIRHETVLVPTDIRIRSVGRIRVRTSARMPVPEWLVGIPVAPVARAVADHARTLTTLDDVRAVVAQSVQRQLCTVNELTAEVAAAQRTGTRLFRQAVGEISAGARSAPEARAAVALRAAGVADFEQNVPVQAGPKTYRADFLWRDLRAILEIDSVGYHFERTQWAATMRRHADLETAGYSVIHIRPAELGDEQAFVVRVKLWLASRRTVLSVGRCTVAEPAAGNGRNG